MKRRALVNVLVDVSKEFDDLTDALHRSVLHHALPQSVLYRVPEGAALWSQMTRDSNTALGSVWTLFDVGPCHKLTETISHWIAKTRSSQAHRTGVMIPGCGDGFREKQLCQSLLRSNPGRSLRIGYIDLATVLLYKATLEFQGLAPECELVAGHFDIEDSSRLRTFRDDNFGNSPVVVLFLGNTLGNIDERQMMRELGSALHPHDLLMLEVLLHDAKSVDQLRYDQRPAAEDPRAPFLLNPLRLLGITPNPEQLFLECHSDARGDRLTRRYSYVFSAAEERISVHPTQRSTIHITADSSLRLLEITSMSKEYLESLLGREFENVSLEIHPYKLANDLTINMGYISADRAEITSLRRGEATPVSAAAPLPLKRWGNLSIGLGAAEVRVAPGPIEQGARFPMVSARKLELGGKKQLAALLRMLCESTDGHTVSKQRVIEKLRFGGSLTEEDRRNVSSENLAIAKKGVAILTSTVADLTRQLKELLAEIDIYSERAEPIFRCDGDSIISAACVRPLLFIEGRTRFGEPPATAADPLQR